MSARIYATFENTAGEDLLCIDTCGGDIDGIKALKGAQSPGTILKKGKTLTATIATNDRVFAAFRGLTTGKIYKMAMTCPKSSSNSATGYGTAGLQKYDPHGTPVRFTFKVGEKDQADWSHSKKYKGDFPDYAALSWGSLKTKPTDTRIDFTITNTTKEDVICTDISGNAEIPNLYPANEFKKITTVLKVGETFESKAATNDRVYITFQGVKTKKLYKMAMVCPKSSSNSATGYDTAGLQTYSSFGVPASFEFRLGQKDKQGWSLDLMDLDDDPKTYPSYGSMLGLGGTRVHMSVKNTTKEDVVCINISGNGRIPGLYAPTTVGDKGSILESGKTFTADIITNDRMYVAFQGVKSGKIYKMAMTCPKSSSNSASGYGTAGLQKYESHGTPVSFSFRLGEKDQADWDNSTKYKGKFPKYTVSLAGWLLEYNNTYGVDKKSLEDDSLYTVQSAVSVQKIKQAMAVLQPKDLDVVKNSKNILPNAATYLVTGNHEALEAYKTSNANKV